MPDLDLRKTVENGISFRRIFVDIISVSFSVFLAFQWQGLIREVIEKFYPAGQNLFEKLILNAGLTVMLVCVIFFMFRLEKRSDK